MVQVGKDRYAIPLLSIEKIVEPDGIFSVGGRAMMTVDQAPLPLVHLGSVLERT
jgi:chemotaxis protein histidine kinase CheA